MEGNRDMADPQYFDIDVNWQSGVTIKPIKNRIITVARDESEIDRLVSAMKRDLDLVAELAKEAIKKVQSPKSREE
jgi:hypothetical protein